jgi:aryl sulfotransferase
MSSTALRWPVKSCELHNHHIDSTIWNGFPFRDLPGQMRRIAGFLDIAVDEARFRAMVEHCGFTWMKRNATKSAPLGGTFWDGGADVFINQGINGRWRDVLTPEDQSRYEAMALDQLGSECAAWLATGERTP